MRWERATILVLAVLIVPLLITLPTGARGGMDFQPYISSFSILLKSETSDLGELTGEFRVAKPSENMVDMVLAIAFSAREPSVDNVTLWLECPAGLSEFGPPSLPIPTPDHQVTLADGENIFLINESINIENLKTPKLYFFFTIGNIQVNSKEKIFVLSDDWDTWENWIKPFPGVGRDLDELSGVTENRVLTVTLREMAIPPQNGPPQNERNWPLIGGIITAIAVVGIMMAFSITRYKGR